jgi:hypothetical protein
MTSLDIFDMYFDKFDVWGQYLVNMWTCLKKRMFAVSFLFLTWYMFAKFVENEIPCPPQGPKDSERQVGQPCKGPHRRSEEHAPQRGALQKVQDGALALVTRVPP